jgi:diguanylate cyclase (GGDEF)-like protein
MPKTSDEIPRSGEGPARPAGPTGPAMGDGRATPHSSMAVHLSDLERAVVKAEPGARSRDAQLKLADALVRREPQRALAIVRETCERAGERGEDAPVVEALLIEAAALRVVGRPHEALAALDGLPERCRGESQVHCLARVLIEMGATNLAINLPEYAQEFLEEALALLGQGADLDATARAHVALGEFWLQCGQWRESTRCFDQAERADHRLPEGNRWLAAVYVGRGQAMQHQGRLAEALIFLDRAIDWGPSLGDTYSLVRALSLQGECLAATGQPARARQALSEADAQAERDGFERLRIDVALLLARLHSAAGEHEQAEARLRRSLGLFERIPGDEREAELHRAIAHSCEARGELERALHHHRRCEELDARSLRLASQERRQRLRLTLRLRKSETERQAMTELSQLLEQRVDERTAELTRTVNQLEVAMAERARFERQARFLAEHDVLTGLPNRALVAVRLSELLGRGAARSGLAVMFLDLDGFKQINDAYGHSIGDRVLRDVCSRLQACLGPDDMLARYGGDEFLILAPRAATVEAAQALCRQVVERFAAPMMIGDKPLFLGCAIGVALAPADGVEAGLLIQNADAAMHHAKARQGSAFGFFSPDMVHPLQRRLGLTSSLRLALQREQFVLHFQPRIARERLRTAGVEALLRWRDPERGLVLPGEFIDVAEQTGLIVELGGWVIREACRHARRWETAMPALLPVGVNLSARQLADPGLVDAVRAAIAEHDIQPSSLEVEITESMLLRDPERANLHLARLRELGVRVALDDFGTGYSNFANLSRLPVDYLKIDRGFVSSIESSDADRAIVAGMVALARALGLKVIAEGVETEAQLARLVELGCDYYQGFRFAPALPAERVEQFAALHGEAIQGTAESGRPRSLRSSRRGTALVPPLTA